MDDVATGAVKYLSTFTDVTSLLGSYSLTDPVVANQGKPYLFAGDILATMEGSSVAAIVCTDFGGWGLPPQLRTMRFRRLQLEVWVDPLRDSSNNITETSVYTRNRGNAVFNAVQYRLQRTDPDTIVWGDMVTIGCQLITEPVFAPEPDGDWLQVGTAYFGVEFTGWTDATE